MRRMKFIFAVAAAVILAGCCCAAMVKVPMDKAWRPMNHTRDAKCTISAAGVYLYNPNPARHYAAIHRNFTVDLTATPWMVVEVKEASGSGEFKALCGNKKVNFLDFNQPGKYQINLAKRIGLEGKQTLQLCCYVSGGNTGALFSDISFSDRKVKIASGEPEFYIQPTFNNAAYYYSGDNKGTVTPFFREKGSKKWQQGLAAAYDPEVKQYRGSIVRLRENTAYELKLTDKSGKTLRSGTFTTWADNVKVAKTIVLDPAKIKDTIVIHDAGAPDAWIRYTQKPGTVLDFKKARSVIKLQGAKYVILDKLNIRGGHKHAIEVNGCSFVRITNSEISGWGIVGEQRCDYNGRFHEIGKKPSGYGINMNGAINIIRGKGIVVERCYIHDPRNRANSWYYSHPAGPQAITAGSPESSVIRYNDFVGSDEHRFNDAVESLGNFNKNGGLNRDADVYGNFMIYCSDDNIELDGGQCNVRCYGNRFEGSYCGVSIQGCMMGPSYVFNNIFLNMGDEFGSTGYTLKSCSGKHYGAYARSYIFNNTFTGRGLGTNIDNIMDYRNNIWGNNRKIDGTNKPHTDYSNVFESATRDHNLDSSTMYGKAGFVDTGKADLRLSGKSPFAGKGSLIPNFTAAGKVDPGAYLDGKDIPLRPLPVSVYPGQLNFKSRKGVVSGDGTKVTVKATCKKFNGKFTIRKNDVFDWFEVTPASGIIKNGNQIELSVRIKPGFAAKYRKYRGAFLVRFENGLSRPVSVYLDTDFKVKPYPVKEGVYTNYIDLTRPTGGKQYPVISDPDGGNGRLLDFKLSSGKIPPKRFTGTKADLAEYEFEVPETGMYMIMVRGKNQNNIPLTDSCFMSLDDSQVVHQSLTLCFSPENRISWVFIPAPTAPAVPYECKAVKLTKGRHVLRIAPRKPIYLDSLCITSDPRIFEER